MKRLRTFLVLAFGFLCWGVMVNIAVAWGCAAWSDNFGVTYVGCGCRYLMVDGTVNPYWSPPEFESAGWPFRSISSNAGAAIEPIWPGFATNTMFYAALLLGGWVLFAAPFQLRRYFRRRRIKRGLCPACAYPVGQSPICTECGGSVA